MLASAGLAAARGAPTGRLRPRALALLACAAALWVGLQLRWTVEGPWLELYGADAWWVYAWADAGLAAIAAGIALAAALPRHPALAALPLAALALPFLDRGIAYSNPGGFTDGADAGIDLAPVGPGAWLALAAVVVAAGALLGRPTGRLSARVSRGPSSRRSRPRPRGRRSGPSPSSGSAP
jgi:hypothetical protein